MMAQDCDLLYILLSVLRLSNEHAIELNELRAFCHKQWCHI